jgi:hypothetical protein
MGSTHHFGLGILLILTGLTMPIPAWATPPAIPTTTCPFVAGGPSEITWIVDSVSSPAKQAQNIQCTAAADDCPFVELLMTKLETLSCPTQSGHLKIVFDPSIAALEEITVGFLNSIYIADNAPEITLDGNLKPDQTYSVDNPNNVILNNSQLWIRSVNHPSDGTLSPMHIHIRNFETQGLGPNPAGPHGYDTGIRIGGPSNGTRTSTVSIENTIHRRHAVGGIQVQNHTALTMQLASIWIEDVGLATDPGQPGGPGKGIGLYGASLAPHATTGAVSTFTDITVTATQDAPYNFDGTFGITINKGPQSGIAVNGLTITNLTTDTGRPALYIGPGTASTPTVTADLRVLNSPNITVSELGSKAFDIQSIGSNWVFENLTIEGSTVASKIACTGIAIAPLYGNVEDVRFTNVTARNLKQGLYFGANMEHVTIAHSRLENTVEGVFIKQDPEPSTYIGIDANTSFLDTPLAFNLDGSKPPNGPYDDDHLNPGDNVPNLGIDTIRASDVTVVRTIDEDAGEPTAVVTLTFPFIAGLKDVRLYWIEAPGFYYPLVPDSVTEADCATDGSTCTYVVKVTIQKASFADPTVYNNNPIASMKLALAAVMTDPSDPSKMNSGMLSNPVSLSSPTWDPHELLIVDNGSANKSQNACTDAANDCSLLGALDYVNTIRNQDVMHPIRIHFDKSLSKISLKATVMITRDDLTIATDYPQAMQSRSPLIFEVDTQYATQNGSLESLVKILGANVTLEHLNFVGHGHTDHILHSLGLDNIVDRCNFGGTKDAPIRVEHSVLLTTPKNKLKGSLLVQNSHFEAVSGNNEAVISPQVPGDIAPRTGFVSFRNATFSKAGNESLDPAKILQINSADLTIDAPSFALDIATMQVTFKTTLDLPSEKLQAITQGEIDVYLSYDADPLYRLRPLTAVAVDGSAAPIYSVTVQLPESLAPTTDLDTAQKNLWNEQSLIFYVVGTAHFAPESMEPFSMSSHFSAGHAFDTKAFLDQDNDGVGDWEDNCLGLANDGQEDLDADGSGDACDPDDDDDGIEDGIDICPKTANAAQVDTDGDGMGNACDEDDDGDGISDEEDIDCPLNANPDGQADTVTEDCLPDADMDGIPDDGTDNCVGHSNPGQLDADSDGKGDTCDPDNDNDGKSNAADNCELVANADQLDTDNDGYGDACDTDDDDDTVKDAADNCPLTANEDQKDSDGDKQGDACDETPLPPQPVAASTPAAAAPSAPAGAAQGTPTDGVAAADSAGEDTTAGEAAEASGDSGAGTDAGGATPTSQGPGIAQSADDSPVIRNDSGGCSLMMR